MDPDIPPLLQMLPKLRVPQAKGPNHGELVHRQVDMKQADPLHEACEICRH